MQITFIPNTNILPTLIVEDTPDADIALVRGSPQGFSGVQYIHMSAQTPNQNGATYFFSRMSTRSISFSFRIHAKSIDEIQKKKMEIAQILSPALGEGTLRVYPGEDGTYYELACVPDGKPSMFSSMEGHNGTAAVATVSFTAYNPWFTSPVQNTVEFTAYAGGFQLPFRLPFTLGEFGEGYIHYAGSTPTPALITITGPFVNPVLINTRTGEKIAIIKALNTGEKIEINTDPATSYVHHIDATGAVTNAFSTISTDSVLWQLQPGENHIQYTESESIGNTPIRISWHDRFEGVM
ncbi:MAG: phage tail family protein [Methanocorpusculum parvum]|nr:phage tail family protein [Methanocorpusculum parvum]